MDCTLRGDLAHTIDTVPLYCQGILERILTMLFLLRFSFVEGKAKGFCFHTFPPMEV